MDIVEAETEADAGVGARTGSAGEWEREPHPSDSLRTFGAVVQALREHAGLSREELAAIVQYSKHPVESVELGRRMPDEAFVERAEGATGNTGALRRAARHLSRGEVGLAAWLRRWARLEREAVSLCTYECRLVPGLLQSEAYARVVFDNSIPLLTDEQTEAQLTARMERQEMLRERSTVPFSFIVEESVLRRRLGGVRVHATLLDHVRELTAAQRDVPSGAVGIGVPWVLGRSGADLGDHRGASARLLRRAAERTADLRCERDELALPSL